MLLRGELVLPAVEVPVQQILLAKCRRELIVEHVDFRLGRLLRGLLPALHQLEHLLVALLGLLSAALRGGLALLHFAVAVAAAVVAALPDLVAYALVVDFIVDLIKVDLDRGARLFPGRCDPCALFGGLDLVDRGLVCCRCRVVAVVFEWVSFGHGCPQ